MPLALRFIGDSWRLESDTVRSAPGVLNESRNRNLVYQNRRLPFVEHTPLVPFTRPLARDNDPGQTSFGRL